MINRLYEEQTCVLANKCIFEFSILEGVRRDRESFFICNKFLTLTRRYIDIIVQHHFLRFSEIYESIKAYSINHLEMQIDSYGHFKTIDGVDISLKLEGKLEDQQFNVDSINSLMDLFDTYLKILILQFQSTNL